MVNIFQVEDCHYSKLLIFIIKNEIKVKRRSFDYPIQTNHRNNKILNVVKAMRYNGQ